MVRGKQGKTTVTRVASEQPRRRTLREERKETTRLKLLAAARQVFSEKG